GRRGSRGPRDGRAEGRAREAGGCCRWRDRYPGRGMTSTSISPTVREPEASRPNTYGRGRLLSRGLRLAVTFLCMAGLAVAPAGAGAGPAPARIGGGSNETASSWFVELASPPTVKGTSKATLKAERDAFKKSATADGVKLTERYSYDTLWNGLSVSVPPAQVAALGSIPGVKAVYPVQTVSLPSYHSDRAEVLGAGTSDGAHGTHVAGIAAADGRGHTAEGQVVGVAPGAKLLAYKVFGCNGGTDTDVMIHAMELALADHADVLNMSI